VSKLLAALLLLLIPSQVLAASGPPPGLAGTLTIVSQDATSVTLHAEQTGGDPVRLTLEQICYNADPWTQSTMWETTKVRFVGSVDVTFDTSSGTYKSQQFTPVYCIAYLMFYFSSSRAIALAGVVTLP
jgi:hypothetical protein